MIYSTVFDRFRVTHTLSTLFTFCMLPTGRVMILYHIYVYIYIYIYIYTYIITLPVGSMQNVNNVLSVCVTLNLSNTMLSIRLVPL